MKTRRLLPIATALLVLGAASAARADHDHGTHGDHAHGAATTENAGVPQKFGAPVTVKKALSVAKLEKKPARFTGKTVKIEGTVKNVCQGRGCWIEIEGPGGATFLAKSLDESVLVPMDCQGWQVVVQGVVTQLTAKGHEGHDHAAHAAAEGHACPAPDFVVSMDGVELKKAVAAKK